MYVYMESERGLFTTGFFDPDGTWVADRDFSNAEDAANRVHYLNGGPLDQYGGTVCIESP